jgi:D-amino-acid dehydrogenase
MPVIGQSPTHANVIYAFGHGHVGVTQSAITGKLVSQLIAGVEPELDLEPFSISRFSKK